MHKVSGAQVRSGVGAFGFNQNPLSRFENIQTKRQRRNLKFIRCCVSEGCGRIGDTFFPYTLFEIWNFIKELAPPPKMGGVET